MTDTAVDTYVEQAVEIGMEGDDVDAERLPRQCARLANSLAQVFRRHGGRGVHTETSGLGYGGNQVVVRNPGHGAADDAIAAAEDAPCGTPQVFQYLAAARRRRRGIGENPPVGDFEPLHWQHDFGRSQGHGAALSLSRPPSYPTTIWLNCPKPCDVP